MGRCWPVRGMAQSGDSRLSSVVSTCPAGAVAEAQPACYVWQVL